MVIPPVRVKPFVPAVAGLIVNETAPAKKEMPATDEPEVK